MQTECNLKPMAFARLDRREVVADFGGGAITSDAGALLLGATDRAIGLVRRFADCFSGGRDAGRVIHDIPTLVGQRVFGIALGYEDLIDHDDLRRDPVLGAVLGKLEAARPDLAPLAGKSTLNRLEHAPLGEHRYHRIVHDPVAIGTLFVDLFLESFDRAPRRIVLDLDATDDPIHGRQEGRFFHGYYDCHCYLPLYIFCGDHLLAAKLRRSNIDASAGATEEVARIVARIRERWPRTRVLLRADSGFAREELMTWCEENGVDFLFGLARNSRLVEHIHAELAWAEDEAERTERAARRFADFRWTTRESWSRRRRVVAKAEWMPGRGENGANPRFIVTSLKPRDIDGRTLYERVYCARGDMENRICPPGDAQRQGAAAGPLRRPHQRGHHEGQSTAPVARLHGLRAALRPAPPRLGPHPPCQSHLRHHPSEAAQDRRPRDRQCAPRACRHRLGLPLRAGISPRPRPITPMTAP